MISLLTDDLMYHVGKKGDMDRTHQIVMLDLAGKIAKPSTSTPLMNYVSQHYAVDLIVTHTNPTIFAYTKSVPNGMEMEKTLISFGGYRR